MVLTAKEEAVKVLASVPETATFEDIMYEMFVAEKLQKARQQIENGNVFTHEQAKVRLGKWLTK